MQSFEARGLRAAFALFGPDAPVTVPELFYEDTRERAIILADCGAHAADLKSLVKAGRVDGALGAELGARLGVARQDPRGRVQDRRWA